MADILFPFADLSRFWWLPLVAILLDRIIGDPPTWPHPVRHIGFLCNVIEPQIRQKIPSERLAGCAATLLVLCCVWNFVWLFLLFPLFFAAIIALYFGFSGLALGQLLREGTSAVVFLENNDVTNARHAIGMLVSRDVSQADHATLCRTLAETLAENVNDAFIAPLFWFLLGGPVGLWLYKAVSTMDSMWGYPHEPWTRFGSTAARLDDIMAFFPARVTTLFLYAAMRLCQKGTLRKIRIQETLFWPGFNRVAEDARKMKSPNAGWPMAACAWIHHAAMGGMAVYAGKTVEKPLLGPSGTAWTTAKIRDLLTILTVAGYGGACVLLSCGWLFHTAIR